MPAIFRSLTVLPVLLLTVTAHGGLDQEKTKCFCDDSGEVYRVAVVATLNDGRGSVGLVDPDGEMIVLNQGETKIGCRLVEVADRGLVTLQHDGNLALVVPRRLRVSFLISAFS